MLIDLKSNDKYVVIVGGGSEGARKALDFVEAGARIMVVSNAFSSQITKLHTQGKICLQKEKVEDAEAFIGSFNPKPDVVVAVTDDRTVNAQLIKHAKAAGCMVYAPDDPSISDFILPAVTRIGDLRIAISTSGKSPAVARLLRQRIEDLIKPEDLLQLQLQSNLRETLKKHVPDQKTRRKLLYAVLNDATVHRLLKIGELPKAQERAAQILSDIDAKKTNGKTPSVKFDLVKGDSV